MGIGDFFKKTFGKQVCAFCGQEVGMMKRDKIKNDEFIVYASQDILFRAKIDDLKAWELLSLDGVVLTAPDLEHEGRERTIIAYYKYYR